MRNRPGGAELLETARETLLRELLPTLPEEQRYTALMIANAMAIAAREQAAGERPLARELARLCSLLNEKLPPVSGREALEREVETYNARLARQIRTGRYDRQDSARQTAWDHLLETTREKLRESNPKYLQACGLE